MARIKRNFKEEQFTQVVLENAATGEIIKGIWSDLRLTEYSFENLPEGIDQYRFQVRDGEDELIGSLNRGVMADHMGDVLFKNFERVEEILKENTKQFVDRYWDLQLEGDGDWEMYFDDSVHLSFEDYLGQA